MTDPKAEQQGQASGRPIGPMPEAEANEILAALTNHDRLVQALEEIAFEAEQAGDPYSSVPIKASIRRIVKHSRAALDAHRQAQAGPANIAGEGEIP